jgi:hypothetical protein
MTFLRSAHNESLSQMAITSAHEKFFRSSRIFRGPTNDVLLLLVAWFHMATGLGNLNDVGSKQSRHPEALSQIRAHLAPGNDGVRCLSNESRIQELPRSAWICGALSSPQISITYSVTQCCKLACCPMDKPKHQSVFLHQREG